MRENPSRSLGCVTPEMAGSATTSSNSYPCDSAKARMASSCVASPKPLLACSSLLTLTYPRAFGRLRCFGA
jgi:hypothetical protein